MIISALRASIVFFGDVHPDLTVGAISQRRFAPHDRGARPRRLNRTVRLERSQFAYGDVDFAVTPVVLKKRAGNLAGSFACNEYHSPQNLLQLNPISWNVPPPETSEVARLRS